MGLGESRCVHCGEVFTKADVDGMPRRLNDSQNVHLACAIRMVRGSVGHQRRLCSCYGGSLDDPPGASKREAALAAWLESLSMND